MEQAFPGSYALTPDELLELWPQAIFSFDTNVLLNVYAYSPETRGKLLQAIEQVGSRQKMFLTWQVASEFHRHRMGKIREQDSIANQLSGAFEKLCEVVETKIRDTDCHHPDVDLERIQQIAEDARAKAVALLSHAERPRVNPLNDEFLAKITVAVGSAIGESPSSEVLEQRGAEWAERLAKQTPPGYKDAKKPDDGVGDYLIWHELLTLAEKEQLPVIFVTNDRKEDWWELYEVDDRAQRPLVPRSELVNEMHARAGVRYHQLLPLEFVELELQSELSPAVTNELAKAPPVEPPAVQATERNFRPELSAGWTFDQPYDFGRQSVTEALNRATSDETKQAIVALSGEGAVLATINAMDRLNQLASGQTTIDRMLNQDSFERFLASMRNPF